MLIMLILLNFTNPVFPQTEKDTLDVINTAVLEGYTGAYRRVDYDAFVASVHPQLHKMKVTSPTSAGYLTRASLLNYLKKSSPQSMNDVTWEVLDITDSVAVIKIMTNALWDLAILTKHDEDWLVSVIAWDYNTVTDAGDAEKAGLTAEQFVQNLYFGNDTDLVKILHKGVSIRRSVSATELETVGFNKLLEQAKTQKWSGQDDNLEIETKVLAVYKSYATVKIKSKWGVEYFNMRYFEPTWYIVNGIWQRTCSAETGMETNQSIEPKHFQLKQNYPNPFYQSTTIKYNLRISDNVLLKIYDPAGQELETLVNGYQSNGEYNITWYPKELQGGIYFYRLQTNEFSETKKLILQK
jgi:hypothetical protein